jgi:hypothetical protein
MHIISQTNAIFTPAEDDCSCISLIVPQCYCCMEKNAFLSLQVFCVWTKVLSKKTIYWIIFQTKNIGKLGSGLTLELYWSFSWFNLRGIIFPLSYICMSFWDERKYTFLQYLKRKFSSNNFLASLKEKQKFTFEYSAIW